MFSVIYMGTLWHLVKFCLSLGLRRAWEGLMFWLGISVSLLYFRNGFSSLCLCQMPLSKSHCLVQKDWFHTTITDCWLNPSIFRENRKAQMSSGPRQHEVMACLKFVNSKLLHFFWGILWQVNCQMLALWEGRAEATVSSEKQITFTSFPILGH